MKKTLALLLLVLLLVPNAGLSPVAADGPQDSYFHVRTTTLEDGTVLAEALINGPPNPPPGFVRTTATTLPAPSATEGVNVLTQVPAFDWSFGCSATSAAMIAGYYDRTGYANMYTGPTDLGVMPLNNSSWPDWVDSGGDTRHQCPLSATHMGLDGRTIEGHVDDYWVEYGDPGPDPLGNDGREHTYGDCTGDYMKTSQSAYGNSDGWTMFWYYTDGSPFYCDDMPSQDIDNDGGHGLMEFYESRGYTVTECYNQYILGYHGNKLGFTWAQYKAEIDAGRPVLFNVEGHTMVGVGYDDAANLMYIHDTWDYDVHTMTWGGSYSGMKHFAVTILHLEAISTPPAAPSDLVATAAGSDQIDLTWTDNSSNEVGFKIESCDGKDCSDFAQIATVGANVTSYQDTGLATSTDYYYRVYAYNAAGNSAYSEANTTTTGGEPPLTVHVGDLDGSSADAPRGRWEATVSITVHDSNEAVVPGALVEGNWGGGAQGGGSCTTDATGLCSVTKGNLKANLASVTFSVSNITSGAGAYVAGDNHDPDGDSNGTTITISKPGSNTPPAVTITVPLDGATFASGATIHFVGTATDAEDGDLTGSLVWTSSIDGQIGTGGSLSAVLSDGAHSITAEVADFGGAAGSDSIGITVGTVVAVMMHVGDLDGSSAAAPRNRWNVTVTITVHDASENPVANATVSGSWSVGGGGYCTTDATGECNITENNIKDKETSATFTVADVTRNAGDVYDSDANHDPDSDSDGTSITILNPQ